MLNGWHNGKLADSVVRHARRLLAATVEVSEFSFRTTERPWRHVWQERIPPDRPGNVPRLAHGQVNGFAESEGGSAGFEMPLVVSAI